MKQDWVRIIIYQGAKHFLMSHTHVVKINKLIVLSIWLQELDSLLNGLHRKPRTTQSSQSNRTFGPLESC